LAASKVPHGTVYAIEACEDTFNFLRINTALNGIRNLSTYHLALSDSQGACTLHYGGTEFPILLASPADLLRRVQMMLVLYHCDLWTTNPLDDLISHLEASGFECKIRYQTEGRGWIVAVNPTWKAA
jgi:FkbM family methyltransferase